MQPRRRVLEAARRLDGLNRFAARVLDRADRGAVQNIDAFLERHRDFDDVERVGAAIVDDRRVARLTDGAYVPLKEKSTTTTASMR